MFDCLWFVLYPSVVTVRVQVFARQSNLSVSTDRCAAIKAVKNIRRDIIVSSEHLIRRKRPRHGTILLYGHETKNGASQALQTVMFPLSWCEKNVHATDRVRVAVQSLPPSV